MVKIGLQIKALLENITNLKAEGEDFRWFIRLKCLNCGEETAKFEYLTLEENAPLKGGRGHASMVIKCKLCSRENSIDIMRDTITAYNAEDSNKFKTIVVFDCRGVEPIDFSPRVGFTAEGEETGTKFPEVDLKEGEWVDYDEKKKESVSVTEIKHQFVTVK
ncbi:CXXC motif containing zinc binding protein-like [Ruditapes philippinarum]|uniref:CXXC motif containing zinc binding protein-like n=1 Tax=Ruditapes philippinarum TaxID=129788 RepID=UPI00295B1773|nr:CXXC motif containing zinc binding protein-like [Ruditapes philippinarum]